MAKFIYTPKVHSHESTNCLLMKEKNPKVFIDYSQTIDDLYENSEDYNPARKRRVLIVFDYMIEDMESNKKIKSYSHRIVFRRKKTQYFTCLYITFLFQSV